MGTKVRGMGLNPWSMIFEIITPVLQGVLPPDELASLMASQHRPNYTLGVRGKTSTVRRSHCA